MLQAQFPSPIGELHLSIKIFSFVSRSQRCFRPLSGSYISQLRLQVVSHGVTLVSVPYRGATFLNNRRTCSAKAVWKPFPSPIGELHFSIPSATLSMITKSVSVPYRGATFLNQFRQELQLRLSLRFRPLSGSYISQYHPRNPMSCLGRIGGLRGKSNFIEMQPFWKVKNSHKSNI